MAAVAPAVALPAPCAHSNPVPQPNAPANPPTSADALAAYRHWQDIEASFRMYRCNIVCIMGANAFKNEVFAAARGGGGGGGAAATQAAVAKALMTFKQAHAREYNSRQHSGAGNPWRVVPFNDGSDPTVPPHNLPLIDGIQPLEALSEQETLLYLQGYGLPVHAGRFDRLKNFVTSV